MFLPDQVVLEVREAPEVDDCGVVLVRQLERWELDVVGGLAVIRGGDLELLRVRWFSFLFVMVPSNISNLSSLSPEGRPSPATESDPNRYEMNVGLDMSRYMSAL